jgi:hypothetical protein
MNTRNELTPRALSRCAWRPIPKRWHEEHLDSERHNDSIARHGGIEGHTVTEQVLLCRVSLWLANTGRTIERVGPVGSVPGVGHFIIFDEGEIEGYCCNLRRLGSQLGVFDIDCEVLVA